MYHDTNKYICPKCNSKNVSADSLNWRTCPDCGWEEKLPMDLKIANEENEEKCKHPENSNDCLNCPNFEKC